MLPDIDTVSRILAETAAEEVLPRFQALQAHEISRKESGDLVTVADVAAEQVISRRLLDLLPGSVVVGEEAVEKDPRQMEALRGEAPVWVIDPVDGTANFAGGKPVFAVMTALIHRGETLAAWIHDPIAGRTGSAEQGSGAWLDGRRLQVAAGGPAGSLQGTLHAGKFSTPRLAGHIQSRRDRLRTVKSLSCAGHEYLLLAAGENHYSLFTKLMPWDHAPGVLIHQEAGGTAKTLDGKAYSAAQWFGPPLLMAPDVPSWDALYDILFGGCNLSDLLAGPAGGIPKPG